MKRMTAALVALLFFVTACSSRDEPQPSAATPTVSLSSPSPASPTPFEPPKLESLIISPGAVGPIAAGTSTADALATNLMVRSGAEPNDECEVPPLTWIDQYGDALDVRMSQDGNIVSVGVFKPGPHTLEGLGVGSTLADIEKVYDDAEMAEAGYNQTGVYVSDGDRWIGFLFNETLNDITPSALVHFVEVSAHEKPELIRDGC
ncbi:MAG: hypothetical protein E6Q27_00720 [Aeromicrobium sp.]|nr:MAG: hypothetical protein E6Q27_00720 [Aeromicrobium sp.]